MHPAWRAEAQSVPGGKSEHCGEPTAANALAFLVDMPPENIHCTSHASRERKIGVKRRARGGDRVTDAAQAPGALAVMARSGPPRTTCGAIEFVHRWAERDMRKTRRVVRAGAWYQ